jgi:transcriptional repressor NrdR
MKCPYCRYNEDKVVDTRSRNDGKAIRRRRLCLNCKRRFITIEEIENKTLSVIKSDGRREPYDRNKLMNSIQIALNKRPVSIEQIEKVVEQIEVEIESDFVREIKSQTIGEFVIKFLRKLDDVAYVRFASVYRNFKDKEEFLKELNELKKIKPNIPRT